MRTSRKRCSRNCERNVTVKRRILGLDPGSRTTGFGVLDFVDDRPTYVASGAVRTLDGDFPQRLKSIFNSVTEIVSEYRPDIVAIESVTRTAELRGLYA